MRAGFEATKEYAKGDVYAHIRNIQPELMRGLQDAVEGTSTDAHVTGWRVSCEGPLPERQNLKVRDLLSLTRHASGEKREQNTSIIFLSQGIFPSTPGEVRFLCMSPAYTEEEIERVVGDNGAVSEISPMSGVLARDFMRNEISVLPEANGQCKPRTIASGTKDVPR